MPFVGRSAELEALRMFNEAQRPKPLFVYGPEGCGKTRLLLEAVRRFKGWFPDGEALYVNMLADRLDDAFMSTAPGLAEFLGRKAAEFMARIPGVGDLVAGAVALAYHYFADWAALGGVARIFVVVDEVVKALGVGHVAAKAKYMQSVMDPTMRSEKLRGKIINYVALTSEGESREELLRHTYVELGYIWNMPRGDFEELYHRVRGLHPGPAPPFEDVWGAFGGNPRALMDLARYGWDMGKVRRDIMVKVRDLVARLGGYRDVLVRVVEDVDYLYHVDGVRDALIRYNLAMPLLRGAGLGMEPPVDMELGIGRYYAWQMPIYRELLKDALRG